SGGGASSFVLPYRWFARRRPKERRKFGKRSGCPTNRPILRGERFYFRGTFRQCAFARAISPDRKRNEEKIDNHEDRHVGLAADAKSVTVQTFTEHEIDAIPGH